MVLTLLVSAKGFKNFFSMASSSNNKPTVYNTNCCVFGCHSRKGADRNIHFHSFPEKNSGILVKVTDSLGQEEEVDKREAWETVLDMDKPVTKHMRVCSKHFITNDYLAKGIVITLHYNKVLLLM